MANIYSDVELPDDSTNGTTFYRLTDDDIQNYHKDNYNLITTYIRYNYGVGAFDLEKMYGSALIDGDLYICVTDGNYIYVNGEPTDPETALEDFDLDDLSEYIEPATDEIISRYATEYEFKPIDIDEIALELMRAGHHFTEIVKDAYDLDLLDNII